MKPPTLTHSVTRCDGSKVDWRDNWVKLHESCGECGRSNGYTWVNEGTQPSRHVGPISTDSQISTCASCKETWETLDLSRVLRDAYSGSLLAFMKQEACFYSAAQSNVMVTGITEGSIE